MNVRLVFVLAAVACFATSAIAAPPWREHYLAVRQLCRGEEAAACRDSLLALRALLPGHPAVLYTLAAASMRLGDRDAALAALSQYADMHLAAAVTADANFRDLAGDSGFARILQRFGDNVAPIAHASRVHRFADPDLIAEDVAWDAPRKRWLVSSVHKRKILAVDAGGRESDFAVSGRDTLWGVFGLAIDAPRNRLWAGTAATAEGLGVAEADRGRSALVCFDLERATVLRRFELPRDGGEHVFGDLTVAADGTVYATDSRGGGVYRVRPEADSLEVVVAPGEFASPQMPLIAPSGERLLVADYSRGFASVDLRTGAVRWLAQPLDLASAGVDGVYWWGGRLLAIQNGVTPLRVMALDLSPEEDRITGWGVLEQASPDLGDPNHGTVAGDDFVFIGRSGWDRMSDKGMRAGTAEEAPVLLRLRR